MLLVEVAMDKYINLPHDELDYVNYKLVIKMLTLLKKCLSLGHQGIIY